MDPAQGQIRVGEPPRKKAAKRPRVIVTTMPGVFSLNGSKRLIYRNKSIRKLHKNYHDEGEHILFLRGHQKPGPSGHPPGPLGLCNPSEKQKPSPLFGIVRYYTLKTPGSPSTAWPMRSVRRPHSERGGVDGALGAASETVKLSHICSSSKDSQERVQQQHSRSADRQPRGGQG